MEVGQSANLKEVLPWRIGHLDVLRGFALVGIGLSNIFTLHTPNQFFAHYAASYESGLNHIMLLGLMVLVKSKFYPIFSFLFGVSAAMMLPKRGSRYFSRRLVGLLLLGALQVLFIWGGDVLLQYAVLGTGLLLIQHRSSLLVSALSAFLLLFSFIGRGWVPPEASVQSLAQELEMYRSASFLEMVFWRVKEYANGAFTWPAFLFYCRIFAFMLLGFTLVKSSQLSLFTSASQLRKTFLLHLLLGIAMALAVQLAGWRGLKGDGYWLKEVCACLYFYALVVCLGSVPVLLWQIPWLQYYLTPLQRLGKLTLTHYLTQNLLFSLLFYGYGLGYFNKLAPVQLIIIYGVILFLQLLLTYYILQKHRQGPLEYLLRWVAGKQKEALLQ